MDEKRLIRVLVAEDHAVVREGLCSVLTARYGVEVVGEAADGLEAVERAQALHPDVILMDLAMPRMTGLANGSQRPPPGHSSSDQTHHLPSRSPPSQRAIPETHPW